MIIGTVVGRIVSTNKHDKLIGSKFLICEVLRGQGTYEKIIAVDIVGVGIGENVLITTGSSARLATRDVETPTDAAIVGIVDEENDLSLYDL